MSTLQGSIGEAAFEVECLKRNIPIYKPVADLYGVDYIIGLKNFLRIQVKTTSVRDARYKTTSSYKIQCRHGAQMKAYNGHFDFMAAYIMPLDLWYMIPITHLNKTTIRINPKSEYCKYKNYKDSWYVIKGMAEAIPMRD